MKNLESELKKLVGEQSWKEVETLVLGANEDNVFELLKKYVVLKEGTQHIVGVLTSLSCSNNESTKFKYELYKKMLTFLRMDLDCQSREQGEVVTLLMMHCKNFQSSYVIGLIDFYLQHIGSGEPVEGRWIDLFSTLITLCVSRSDLVVSGKSVSGEEYLAKIISELCSFKWCSQTGISLLSMFNELTLPKELFDEVLEKCRKMLDEVEYQSVPPIIYHLVLLGRGRSPGALLQVIVNYFNKLSRKCNKRNSHCPNQLDEITDVDDSEKIEENSIMNELNETQSTVVLHIINLAQFDPGLVKEFIRINRNSTWLPQILFTSFNLLLSLTLANIDRYKDQIIDSMKSCILKHYRLQERRRKSFWLREAFEDDLDLVIIFKDVVNDCKGGWNQTNLGLVNLCFNLLESGGGMKGETYPSQQCVALASNVLPLILRKEPHLAAGILRQLSGLIFTATSPTQYVELLGRLVKVAPLVLLDHVTILRELLEQLGYLPLPIATLILHMFLPLFKISLTLKDALMIILRKMLFSKQVESRQAAVEGFLQFLRHFKVMGVLPSSQGSLSFSSAISQISADIHASFSSSTNEALCLELLGVLSRCFSQQSRVRSTLYAGLYDVSRSNPKVCVSILNMLQQHLKQFIDPSPHATNPVILQKTVSVQGDTVTLVEPLGELVACLSQCTTWFESHRNQIADGGDSEGEDDDDETLDLLNDIHSSFDSLTERLAYCDMDDLDFSTASFSALTTVGRQNVFHAEIMVSVIESLINQTFYNGALKSLDSMKKLISLFKTQKKIMEVVSEMSKAATNKKGDSSKRAKRKPPTSKTSFTFKSILSLKLCTEILGIVIDGEETANQECVEIIKNNYEFQAYVLFVIGQIVGRMKSMSSTNRDRLLPYMRIVAHLLLGECYQWLTSENLEGPRELEKLRSSLTILHSIIAASGKYYKDKLPQILKEMVGKSATSPYDNLLQHVVKKCQRMLLNILQNENKTALMKEAVIIIQIMNIFINEISHDSQELKDIYTWIDQICKDYPIDNASLTEALLSLLFDVFNAVSPKGRLAPDISREIHFQLGDIEQDISVEECGVYKIITDASAHCAISILMVYCDNILSILELTLQKLKAAINAGIKVSNELQQNICTKFASIIQCLHEVIKTSIPQGASLDNVIKTTTKIYNTLTLFVKYYLDYFKMVNSAQISDKFEKLVHVSANLLKEHVFKMIKYVNNTYQESEKKRQGVLTARAIKEAKLIPAVVFAMEEYEKSLIQLSKKCHVNLMAGMKTSTSRDFRINPDVVEGAMRRERDVADDSDETTQQPSKKRKK